MNNPRAFFLALLVAIIATAAQCRYVAAREQALLYDSEPMKTVVAKRDIPPNVRLDETMVIIVEVPRKWQQPKALGKVEDVMQQISSEAIFTGEQVLATKLVNANDAGLAYFVTTGYRAVAIAVDVYNAVGGHIKPGNAIDILGSFDFGVGDKADLRTITLMQNVRVLSVVDDTPAVTSDDVVPLPPEGTSAEPDEDRRPSRKLSGYATLAVEVTPADAAKLAMAQELGKLSVSLRSLNENEGTVEVAPATVQNTLGIPEQVRFKSRPSYRVIEGGGGN